MMRQQAVGRYALVEARFSQEHLGEVPNQLGLYETHLLLCQRRASGALSSQAM